MAANGDGTRLTEATGVSPDHALSPPSAPACTCSGASSGGGERSTTLTASSGPGSSSAASLPLTQPPLPEVGGPLNLPGTTRGSTCAIPPRTEKSATGGATHREGADREPLAQDERLGSQRRR